MNRTLIPKSTTDRIILITSLVSMPLAVFAFKIGAYLSAATLGGFFIITLVIVYWFPERAEVGPSTDKYTEIIKSIEVLGSRLSEISTFLESERSRITDTEATLKKLNDEKTKLEPLLKTQREAAEAILAAHSNRTARQAWKERWLGFVLGIISSVIASIVFEYFR